MLRADDPTSLSLLYHLNSLPWAIPEGLHEPAYKEIGGGVALPDPGETNLTALIRARRSAREFTGEALASAEIATILGSGFGIIESSGAVYRRAGPSAGGLYPLEVYVVSGGAISHYNVRDHSLEPVGPAPEPGLLSASFLGQPWVESAGALFVISAVFARTQTKYGPRGYRYALIEAGHVAQNFCLIAADLGLGSVCLGGFDDVRVNEVFGLDGRAEAVIYGVAVGYISSEHSES